MSESSNSGSNEAWQPLAPGQILHRTPTAEQAAAHRTFTETLPLVPAIMIRDPTEPEVASVPGHWQSLDSLVAERGTRFQELGEWFDIAEDVKGHLGQDKVALLVLKDPTTPRLPSPAEQIFAASPEERAALGLGPLPSPPSDK